MQTQIQKDFYEQATKNILARLDTLNLSQDKKQQAVKFITLFRESFKKEEVKKATFLDEDNKKYWDLGYDSGGFCRVASITFAIAMDFHDWQLMAIGQDKWAGNMSHHWLTHIPSGKILDITYDQFAVDGLQVPYSLGIKVGYNLSLQDETHKFAKCVGIDLLKTLVNTKGK